MNIQYLLVGLSVLLTGCSAAPADQLLSATPVIRTTLNAAGVENAQDRFRSIFCQTNQQIGADLPDYRPCQEALIPAHSQPTATRNVDSPPTTPRPRTLVFVPGLFGECVQHLARPFSDSYDRLQAMGFRVLNVPTEGRSSSQRNAELIDAFLAEEIKSDEEFIVIAYSKGVVDMLEAMRSDSPNKWISQMRALVSIAGAVMGSPIAAQYEAIYATLFARLKFPTCPPGDGGALSSMTPLERANALNRMKLPSHVLLLSLSAIATKPRVNAMLSTFHSRLSSHNTRNDGQLLAQDTIIPGSIFLGYVHADHWAIALPFNRSTSSWAKQLANHNDFPREVLLASILAFVEERFPRAGTSQATTARQSTKSIAKAF